ncbi:MAG: hypothetical protein WCB05_15345 [Candidatus Sulfotelmatobacter sp.]
MKTKPTRFAGWVGRISLSSYPHAGVRRQQHVALAAKGLDMLFRIGAPDAGVKRHKPRGTGDSLIISCIAKKTILIVSLAAKMRLPVAAYGQRIAAVCNGAVGRILG